MSLSSLLCTEVISSFHVDEPDNSEWLSPSPNARQFLPDLLAAEAAHLPVSDYYSRLITRFINPTARQDAVNWILKLNEFYCFSPVTGCLAVSYLDRYLSSNSLEFGWGMQLAAVACLSVAVKMEETQLPGFLDLQILEPKYVFEAKTVARMELHLMRSLGWRMHGVTAFDFIEPLLSPAAEAARPGLVSRAANLIVSTYRVVDFMAYRPSVIAAAALLCSAEEIIGSSAGGVCSLVCLGDWINKEEVAHCRKQMEEYLIDTCSPSLEPSSPVGVLDAAACGSCDSQNFAAAVAEKAEASRKRQRLNE